MNAILKVFHRFLDELEAAKVPYMVMGGWAVQVWKYLRQWASRLSVLDAIEKLLPA